MSVTGLDSLSKKLAALSELDLKRCVGRGIKLVQGEAKRLCPVNDGELRDSIYTSVEVTGDATTGTCYTNKKYAPYVEFGTGPIGQENHEGISPAVNPVYKPRPWWIHENDIDERTAEKYHWPHIDTPDGRFYLCHGQKAHPFMYPALKNHEEEIVEEMSDYASRHIKEILK